MGHLYFPLFNVPQFFLSDNHDISIADLINACGAREISIDHIDFSQDPIMDSPDQSDPDLSTNQEPLLSSSSATVFLHFVLNGGGGYLDPGVEAELIAAKEAMVNVGVSWAELLGTLRDECRDTKDVS